VIACDHAIVITLIIDDEHACDQLRKRSIDKLIAPNMRDDHELSPDADRIGAVFFPRCINALKAACALRFRK
jgi:hypothetical protein